MKFIHIFLFELKHFWRNPFKVVAVLLFCIASIYALHNAASLYYEQIAEIEKINLKVEEQKAEILDYFNKGQKGPENRPWIDVTTPFWAIWNSPVYANKTPSTAMVYSIGQAEQYGFYKRITFMASPYDADMAQEIANPERLENGTLDFSFVILFLLPLVLLILVYNLKASETEQGFLALIEVQTASKNTWLFSRLTFYVVLMFSICLLLIFYGSTLTQVLSLNPQAFGQFVLLSFLYLLFWSFLFFFILKNGKTIIGNTLKMIGLWLILAFVIPAGVHQYVGIVKPANLMVDYIDAKRDDRDALFSLPEEKLIAKLEVLFPEIKNTVIYKDSTKAIKAINQSSAALANELVKNAINPIEAENQDKNKLVTASFWFNPVVFFQNTFNHISETHYDDYQNYRNTIQTKIDQQIETLVLDLWHDVKVNKAQYLEYNEKLSITD